MVCNKAATEWFLTSHTFYKESNRSVRSKMTPVMSKQHPPHIMFLHIPCSFRADERQRRKQDWDTLVHLSSFLILNVFWFISRPNKPPAPALLFPLASHICSAWPRRKGRCHIVTTHHLHHILAANNGVCLFPTSSQPHPSCIYCYHVGLFNTRHVPLNHILGLGLNF